MYIKELNVKNKRVNMVNVSMDLSVNGIYILKGENGSGKTTLMEEIVFGKYNAKFQDKEELELFENDRFNLFSYVPQITYSHKIKVLDYIKKGNENIKTDNILMLLNQFLLDGEILKKSFNLLSGGEKVKVKIISALLKDTPYIFLDEPTNNLDDEAVDILLKILDDLAKRKVIIIITHDKRVELTPNAEYIVTNETVTCVNNTNDIITKKREIIRKNPPSMLNMMLAITKNIAYYLSIIFFVFVLVTLACNSHFKLKNDYNTEELPRDDFVLIRYNDYFCIENQRVAETNNIIIENEKYDKYMEMIDIPKVAAIDGVKKVFIKDVDYFSTLETRLLSEKSTDTLNFFSCPQILYDDLFGYTSIDCGIRYVEGNLPKDECNEVAISPGVLCTYFGYDEETAKNAIGDYIEINVNGEINECIIVGLLYYDMIMLSYNVEYNYGIYCYDQATYDEFCIRQNEYAMKQDALIGAVEECLLVVDSKKVDTVQNRVLKEYPANNYYSNHFVKAFAKDYNMSLFCEILIPNLIVSSIMSIIIYIVNKGALAYNYRIINDYENYYINRRRIRKIYRGYSVYQFVLVTGLILVINSVLSEYAHIGNYFIIINGAINLISFVISHYVKGEVS